MLYKSYVFMNIYLYCVWCFRDERLSESWHLIGHVRYLNVHIGEKVKKYLTDHSSLESYFQLLLAFYAVSSL